MTHPAPDPVGPELGPAPSYPTLTEEHAALRGQVELRARALLTVSGSGSWPQPELEELLNYLRREVLRQVTDEEWLLFRVAHHASGVLAALRREHLELRLAVDELADAAATRGQSAAWSTQRLVASTQDLCAQLGRHFTEEERLLADASSAAPATATLGSRPHGWYPLIQAPVIEMDSLPGPLGADAVLERLLSLDPGEHVQIRSSSDPSPLWRCLNRAGAGDYSHTYTERGPQHWSLEITRRQGDSWTPHPYA